MLEAGAMNQNKSIFLVVSMVPWLLAGGALIYLAPAIAHQLLHSETTEMWLTTLGRSGYYPQLAIGVTIVMSAIGTALTILGSKYLPSDRRLKAEGKAD
jgi:uncharacterized membrane protein